MKRILFVCLGNICRSPLAEGIAAAHIAEKGYTLEADSAGTSSWHRGEAPCNHAIEVAKQHNIDIASLRSRPVDADDQHRFDYIIALDRQNQSDLEAKGFQNVYLLGDFGGFGGADVPDPYYFPGFKGFEKIYGMIERSVEDLLEKVKNERI
jgi:protein-tyrosine phosphatase